MKYESFDCQQIAAELVRLNPRLREVTQAQNDAAQMDQMGVVNLFMPYTWPVAAVLLIPNDSAPELSRLKGENDALQQAVIQKNCTGGTSPQIVKSDLEADVGMLDTLRAKGLLTDDEYNAKKLQISAASGSATAQKAEQGANQKAAIAKTPPKILASSDTFAAVLERGVTYNFIDRGEQGDIAFGLDGAFSGFGGLYKGTFELQGNQMCLTSAILGERHACVEYPTGKRSGDVFRIAHPEQGEIEVTIK
jgi:hypothetical protein